MIYILVIFTSIPAWFVGPLPSTQLTPNGPVVWYEGPSLAVPAQSTPDGHNRTIIIVDPPAPGRAPYPLHQRPQLRPAVQS